MRVARHLVIFALTASATAHAETETYTTGVLLADLGAVAVEGIGLYQSSSGSDSNKIPGLLVFATAAPLVHLYHHKYGRAGVDFAVRTALPLGGYLLAYSRRCMNSQYVDCNDGNYDKIHETELVVLGSLVALGVEYAVLRHDDVVPTVAPAPGGVTVGFAGRW